MRLEVEACFGWNVPAWGTRRGDRFIQSVHCLVFPLAGWLRSADGCPGEIGLRGQGHLR